jgi:hypothetical protein
MRAVLLAAVFVGCVAFGTVAGARGSDYERKSLRDIGPFNVELNVSKGAIQHGLNNDAIEAAVELRLRRNGIKLGDNTAPYLVVAVRHVQFGSDITLWLLEVEFRQPVTVQANGELMLAATWRKGREVVCLPSKSPVTVSDALDGLVDQFINDYLAANEKIESGTER